MNKEYSNPTIEIIEFNNDNVLTASFGNWQNPGDNEVNDSDFWS